MTERRAKVLARAISVLTLVLVAAAAWLAAGDPTTSRGDVLGAVMVLAAVYFSCLEALNNIAKYAHASSATISLSQRNGSLEVTVRDDGRGFDTRTSSLGTGLQGMADRLDAIDGEVRIESEPGSGTTASVSVPMAGSA